MNYVNHVIETITFEEILPIWKNHLWPERTSPIEPNSAMVYLGGYNMSNMKTTPTFFAYKIDGKIAGVNSGHMCANKQYRSRGLYVFEEYRGMGVGTKLLLATIQQGRREAATMCWSYPRFDSWKTYDNAGFRLTSEYIEGETGYNAYCIYEF